MSVDVLCKATDHARDRGGFVMTTDDRIAEAEASLRAAKQAVESEIRAYPRPISGCDAQFNALLAQRQRLNAAQLALARQPLIPTSREPDPRPVWV
jgi:hypothetical protein